MEKETLTGIIDAKMVAIEAGGTIYKQGKAKFFNVLESQIENPQRLKAAKRITEDILTNIARDVSTMIQDILGDWTTEVEAEGLVAGHEAVEAEKEYQEIKGVLRIHD